MDVAKDIMLDAWKAIPSEPDFEASICGAIRRRVASKCRPVGHIVPLYVHTKGYRLARLRGRPYYVHRLVVEAFFGSIPLGMLVNHKDGDKTNNALSNLEIVTPAENVNHAIRLGLQQAGRMDDDMIREIRAAHKQGARASDLRRKYGVPQASMTRLLRGESYKHVV